VRIINFIGKFFFFLLFIFIVLQFPFCFETIKDHTKTNTPASKKPIQLPKVKPPANLDTSLRKRKKPSSAPPRQSLVTSLPSIQQPHSPSVPLQSIKSLPLTIFDFNGSQEYYEHMSPFIDTKALHLICIHTVNFHETTPTDIEDVFHSTSSYPMIRQLFQILQLLCEKVTEKNAIIILPIATYIDLYDKRPQQDK
jgi:GTPase SAR1 family protein